MKEVSSRMKSWKSVKETHETYINAFESVTSTLDGLYDEFVDFVPNFVGKVTILDFGISISTRIVWHIFPCI